MYEHIHFVVSVDLCSSLISCLAVRAYALHKLHIFSSIHTCSCIVSIYISFVSVGICVTHVDQMVIYVLIKNVSLHSLSLSHSLSLHLSLSQCLTTSLAFFTHKQPIMSRFRTIQHTKQLLLLTWLCLCWTVLVLPLAKNCLHSHWIELLCVSLRVM